MGADAFVSFVGIRYELSDDPDALEPFERETDPRQVAAGQVGLDQYVSRATEGDPYFLYVGRLLGSFGYQDDTVKSLTSQEVRDTFEDVSERLRRGGFEVEPELWFQFEGQY